MDLSKKVRAIKDYPVEGIVFRDITTLLNDKDAFIEAIDQMVELRKNDLIDKVVGIEARGFILGAAVAYKLGCGFIPARKPGKLPYESISESYELEYGTDSIEIHTDAIKQGERILIIDDLLATGGTALAAAKLVEKFEGNIVGLDFLIELDDLGGRDKLNGYDVKSILTFEEK